MSAADIALSQPLNPAGALLEKFDDEEPESLEDEVDVKIFRESSPIKESVIEEQVAEIVKENGVHSEENGVGESEEETVDEVTESEVTGSSEAEDGLLTQSVITSVLENSPDGKIVTRSTTKRRSTRMTRHTACNALFSDEETVEPEEMTLEEKEITPEGQSLRKILIISILLVLLANLVAYIHINNPGLIAGHCNTVKSWFVEEPSSEEVPA